MSSSLLVERSRRTSTAAARARKRRALRPVVRRVGRAIHDFQLIEDGDRILCAVSGGKDSFAMLHVLEYLRGRAPVRFDLVAVTVDQGFPGFRVDVLRRYFETHGYTHHIERTDIAQVIDDHLEPEETHCSMCAKLRRGVLYRLAPSLGCNKIALGHHADDLLETLLMSQFFNGEICSMPPRLKATDGRNTVIRPLCYVWERDTTALAAQVRFPVIRCPCPTRGDGSLKRRRIKALLRALESEHAGIKASLLSALSNVRPRHLLVRQWLEGSGPSHRP